MAAACPSLAEASTSPNEPPMLESLSFTADGSTELIEVPEEVVSCLLCPQQFNVTEAQNDFLKHLLQQHKLVIADVKLVANFKKYLDYWRQRFKDAAIIEFCSVIKTNTKDTDVEPAESYYLLCDALPEDKSLRVTLQQEKLEEVLAQQQREREDTTFSHDCLFCRQHFNGSSAEVFNHMAKQHGFSVGLPDNLVYTSEFLQLLQGKLSSLQCLYCEKTFRDRHLLKEHMRKKLHKRINSANATYDKFYIINYLELGKNWKTFEHEGVSEQEGRVEEVDTDDSNNEWEDWREESGAQTVCLFCSHKSTLPQSIIHHMKGAHQFDLLHLKQTMSLNFYQQVKLINYIRRQMHQCCCIQCLERFFDHHALMAHMRSSGHLGQTLDTTLWDQPQYYFPTYEDDNLLCVLDVDDDDNSEVRPLEGDRNRETVVIAEDVPVHDSILAQKDIRMKIIMS